MNHSLIVFVAFQMIFATSTGQPLHHNKQILFSGMEWSEKYHSERSGPGDNYFGHHPRNVTIDNNGRLHLRVIRCKKRWLSAEVATMKETGYGEYKFYIENPLNKQDDGIVLGLFLYNELQPPFFNEIDIEISKWGYPKLQNTQYVVHDHPHTPTKLRFDTPEQYRFVIHQIQYMKDSVHFASFYCRDKSFFNPVKFSSASFPIQIHSQSHLVKMRINFWVTEISNLSRSSYRATIHRTTYSANKK